MTNAIAITPIQLQAPRGADHWRKLFNLADLTLLPGSFERVDLALKHPSSSADRVASAMKDDPALCLHFFLRANRLVQRSGNEVHSLPHMISLLGFTTVAQILKSLPVAERPLPFYWQQLQVSLLRRNLLMRLPLHNLGIDPTQLEFSVLFSDCEQWLRWHFATREQLHYQGLARNPKIGPIKAQQLVFGTDVGAQLRLNLQHQSLPNDLKETLQQNPKSLKQILKSLLKGIQGKAFSAPLHKRQSLIFLLDRLVANFCSSPIHSSTKRYQQLVAQLLQIAEASVAQNLHQVAGELAPLHASLIDTHPARRLLCAWPKGLDEPIYALPSPQHATAKKVPQKPVAVADTSTPNLRDTNAAISRSQPNYETQNASANRLLDNRFLNANLVRQGLLALTKGEPSLNSLNTIFQTLSDALQQGMGMSFGAILVPITDGTWQPKCQFDEGDLPPMEQLPTTHLFSKMSAKPAAILIDKDNRAAILEQLPSQLKVKLDERELLLASLFLNTKLVAILLAGEVDLAPPRVRTCKRLAQATQLAIARLALQVQRQSAIKR
ncbi:hypothetical protein QWY82_00555 [Simiduia curdlanivorans]|uniref:HDOD domain-containing protein n=1 Tax=Simiduia curdlanivorans TaxID=1492769 RepID=A0ABV8V480_9GAMM|nr:hypothetical protein [Simiduia curdlanivorans]MDN3637283.1 hypothetical protein [Simiduia curdlanivorans]